MSINIEIEYIKRIERENEELKNDLLRAEAMEDYWNINSSELEEKVDNLRQDLQKRCNRCIELNDENKKLKQRIKNFVTENTKLQNDLFSEQLTQDETEDYINKLKKEIVHLKECNLRYRNHNELLESIIGIRNNVIE